jgi:hypothetical protein
MLLQNTENIPLISKIGEIYCSFIEFKSKPKEFQNSTMNETILQLTNRILFYANREKKALKGKSYSVASMGLFARWILACLDVNLDTTIYMTMRQVWDPIVEVDSIPVPLLHVSYLRLLDRVGDTRQLVQYVQSRYSLLCHEDEWLQASYGILKDRQPVSEEPIETMQLLVQILLDIAKMQLQRNQNTQQSLEQLEEAILHSASLIPSNGEELKQWISRRQEMLASLQLLKAMCELEHVSPLVRNQKDFEVLCRVYENLCLSLVEPASQMPTVHTVDTLHLLKCIVSFCEPSSLETRLYAESALFQSNEFKRGILFSNVTHFQGVAALEKIKSLDTMDFCMSAMEETPYDLVRMVNIAYWSFPDRTLIKLLTRMFPILGEKDTSPVNVNSSPRRLQELKRTPTILDVEVFLVLLILDRQLSVIQHYKPGSDGELFLGIAHTHPWRPPASAMSFWRHLVSHFGINPKSSKVQHPYSAMKLSNSLDELRGVGKKNWKHLFGLLAIAYSKLEDRESDTKAFVSLFESLKSGARVSGPSVLFGNSFDVIDSTLE